jgi:hypothetical protein
MEDQLETDQQTSRLDVASVAGPTLFDGGNLARSERSSTEF